MDQRLTDPPQAFQSAERMSRPRMAKVASAHVRKADTWKADAGRAVDRARKLLGWTLKEFAVAVDRDERQCARWFDGTDRPQLDAIFSVPELRRVFLVAMAQEAGDDQIEVTTTITIRRRA